MKTNRIFFVLIIIFIPKFLLADVITPLSVITLPALPLIILLEALFVFLWVKKIYHLQLRFVKALWVISLANLGTSLLGTFIPLYKYAGENLMWIVVAFVMSVVFEWLVYIPFLSGENLNKKQLGVLSFGANLVTYIPIGVFMGMF